MSPVVDIVGWVGALLVLAAYGLLTARRLPASGVAYQLMNFAGAACLMLNAAYNAAWPSSFVNLVWCGIGVYGLLRARAAEPRATQPPG